MTHAPAGLAAPRAARAARHRLWWCLMGATALLLSLDQFVKWVIATSLPRGEVMAISAWFNLVHVLNPGASFSFLADAGGWQRHALTAVGALVSVALAVLLWRGVRSRLESAAYVGLIGGALGNVADRLRIGAVVDYLDLHYYPQGYGIDTFAKEGIRFEGGFMPLDISAPVLPAMGADWTRFVDRFDHMASFGFMIADSSRGRVVLGPGGAPQMLPDLLEGRLQAAVLPVGASILHVRSGRLVLLRRVLGLGLLAAAAVFGLCTEWYWLELGLAHVHNFVAILLFYLWRPRTRALHLWPLALFALGGAALMAGLVPLGATALGGFAGHETLSADGQRAWLAPGLGTDWATRLVLLFSGVAVTVTRVEQATQVEASG